MPDEEWLGPHGLRGMAWKLTAAGRLTLIVFPSPGAAPSS